MTLFPIPEIETAQNNPNSGDQHTLSQVLSTVVTPIVQLIPFDDVITLFPVPVAETAQNIPNSADQHTLVQLF